VIEGYTDGDVHLLDIRDGDGFGVPPKDERGPAWTMKKDGRPIACGGFVGIGDGMAVVWVMATDEVRGHGMKLCRFARNATKIVFETMGWHRIHAAVRVDRPEYQRWAELMGFEREGCMRKAAPDKTDLYLYARVI
jgi:RimJ/RimL family protein N-acetyltransferase